MLNIMRNLTLLTDLYQLTMMNGYFKENAHEEVMVFDVFFRNNQVEEDTRSSAASTRSLTTLRGLHFEEEDITYLKNLKYFDEGFLEYLRHFRFTGRNLCSASRRCDVPGEPILRVKAKAIEAQFIETAILCIINFQSLIITKASMLPSCKR